MEHFQFSSVFRVRLRVDFLNLTAILAKRLGSTPKTYTNPNGNPGSTP